MFWICEQNIIIAKIKLKISAIISADSCGADIYDGIAVFGDQTGEIWQIIIACLLSDCIGKSHRRNA